MNYQVVLVGSSGHSRVISDIARERGFEVLGFLDDDESRTHFHETKRLGPVDSWKAVLARYPEVRFVFGLADNALREAMVRRFPDVPLARLIHPHSFVARTAKIGAGTVVMAGAVVNDGCEVGCHCVLNTGSILDHDGVMEDFSGLGPGAVTGGHVTIGRQSFVGLGANVVHGRRIGKESFLAAGATLVRDLPDRVVAMGVPARICRERKSGDPYLP